MRLKGKGSRLKALAVVAALALVSCSREEAPDAYGNVEATEVVVSPEVGGQLTTFPVEEGQTLAAGDKVGTVDPTQLTLQRSQLVAQRDAAASRVGEVDRQVAALSAQRDALQAQHDGAVAQRGALQSQLEIAKRNHERMQRLFTQQAATSQQLDQAERDDRVLQDQVKAQDEQIQAQERQVAAQTSQVAATEQQQRTAKTQVVAAEAQVAQLDDRIRRSTVSNPSSGTVLVTYVKPGEIVQAGQALYKIADMAPWVQQVSIINPVRHFVTISRAILMKGAGLTEIAQPLLILIGTAVVVLFVAVQQYQKRAA